MTRAELFALTAQKLKARRHPPFDFAVVDEAQDVSVPQLRFLAALDGDRANSLFFAGDLGQRIFQTPFSWKALGVDVRGRSQTLKINYRTSHQIRQQADLLLGAEAADVDGNVEDRRGTISAFKRRTSDNPPRWKASRTRRKLSVCGCRNVGTKAWKRWKLGYSCARRPSWSVRARRRAKPGCRIGSWITVPELAANPISISTMHLAKGLEFRAVAVMACDDEVIPLQERIETVADDADLEEVYNTERHLLYVALHTRTGSFAHHEC